MPHEFGQFRSPISGFGLISLRHLPDDVYALAVGVFSEQELVDLNLTIMSINSWNRLAIAFRYQPDRE